MSLKLDTTCLLLGEKAIKLTLLVLPLSVYNSALITVS
jgi:hypothetical protein